MQARAALVQSVVEKSLISRGLPSTSCGCSPDRRSGTASAGPPESIAFPSMSSTVCAASL
eukprot:1942183-Rhodomonas_salina.1